MNQPPKGPENTTIANHGEQLQNLPLPPQLISNNNQNGNNFFNQSQQQQQQTPQVAFLPQVFPETWLARPNNETQRTNQANVDISGSIYASAGQGLGVPREAPAHNSFHVSEPDLFRLSSQGLVSSTPQHAKATTLLPPFLGEGEPAVSPYQANPFLDCSILSPTITQDADKIWQNLLSASVNWNMLGTLNMHELEAMSHLCEISAKSQQCQRQPEQLPESILAMLIQEQRQLRQLRQRSTESRRALQAMHQQAMAASSTSTPSQLNPLPRTVPPRGESLPASKRVVRNGGTRATMKRKKQSTTTAIRGLEASVPLTLADSVTPCPSGSEKDRQIHSPTNVKSRAPASEGPTTFGDQQLVECLTFEEAFLSRLSERDESGIHTVDGTGSVRLVNCPLSRTCMKSLLTWNEPNVGADVLTRLALSHNEVPRKQNCMELLDALTQGPKCGMVLYPDCARMEHVKEFRDILLQSKPRMHAKFANLQPYSWWAKVVDVVSQPAGIYCAKGDENRITSAPLVRVGQSLFVKHSGMETLEMILRHQLEPFCLQKGKPAGDTKSKVELALRTVCILNTLFSDEEGTLKALTQLVRAAILNWIHCGHYQSAYFRFPESEEVAEAASSSGCPKEAPRLATATDVQFVSSAFRKLSLVMGKLVSYMAWLHTVQNKAVQMSDTAVTIASVVKNELKSTTFDPSQSLTISAKDHWEDIKLQFCRTLEKAVLDKVVATLLECDLKWFGEVITGEESEVDEDELRAWLDEPVPDDWGL